MSNHRCKQLGYAFEHEVGEGLNKLPGFNFKIPDTRTMQFKTVKVPADFIYAGTRHVYFIEAKSTQAASFPLRNIKDHQLSMGNEINKNSIAKYFFVIYMRRYRRVFMVDVQQIINWIKKNPEIYSIKIEKLEKMATEITRYTARYNDGKCAFIDFNKNLK